MNRGRPWILFTLAVISFNLYLLLSLNSWFGLWVQAQYLLALVLVVMATIRVFLRKAPTLLQMICGGVIILTPWLCSLGRPYVLVRAIEGVGTSQLLQDARTLAGAVRYDDAKLEAAEADQLIGSTSFRALNPDLIKFTDDAVVLLLSNTFGDVEVLVVSTDPSLVPGPVNRRGPESSRRANRRTCLEREISSGIRWQLWIDSD